MEDEEEVACYGCYETDECSCTCEECEEFLHSCLCTFTYCEECENDADECVCKSPHCECGHCLGITPYRCECKIAMENNELPCAFCLNEWNPSVVAQSETLMDAPRDRELWFEQKEYISRSEIKKLARQREDTDEGEGKRIMRILNWISLSEDLGDGYRVGYVTLKDGVAVCAECKATAPITSDMEGMRLLFRHAMKHGSIWDRPIPNPPSTVSDASLEEEIMRTFNRDAHLWWREVSIQQAYIADHKRGRVTLATSEDWLRRQVRLLARKTEKSLSETPTETYRQVVESWLLEKDEVDHETLHLRELLRTSNGNEREFDYWNSL